MRASWLAFANPSVGVTLKQTAGKRPRRRKRLRRRGLTPFFSGLLRGTGLCIPSLHRESGSLCELSR